MKEEQLSAMMDDALADPECDGCVRQLKSDPDLRATWELYHLIGDTLRGHMAPDLADRVRARLAAEPTVLAPRSRRPARRATWYALSAAASVAAVALVGWMALPLFDLSPGSSIPVAQAPQAVTPTAAVPTAHGVTDYLLAHQRFSPSLAIGGIAPYIRSVAEENEAR
ncbi:MAG TPA: sigma-E factor negative regulatory protein [Burkholderiales bacterium]|nr:sigma-E factor negative regulatory protein [Burkholderiales bacterium]